MQNEPKFSVIMLNYNGLTYLGDKLNRCISAALNSDYNNYEFIFVDNNSNDGTVEHVQKYFAHNEKVRIIRLNKNYGSAYGYNRGALESSKDSKYLVFLHNDIEIPKYWIREMGLFMERSDASTVGAISAVYDVKRSGNYGCVFVEYPSLYVLDMPELGSIVEVNHFSTGCGIIKRGVFLSLGGFDEGLFSWYDEVEIARKVKLIGGKIMFNPKVSAIHHCAHIHFRILGIYRNIEIAEENRMKLCLTFLEIRSLLALLIHELYRLLITPIRLRGTEAYRTSMVIKTLFKHIQLKALGEVLIKRRRFQAYRKASDRMFFMPWYVTTMRYPERLPRKAKLSRLLYMLFA